jgi:DNA-binding CsgD family transcriptional regulator
MSDIVTTVYSSLLADLPLAFSVFCGSSSLEGTTIAKLTEYGIAFDPDAVIALVLDAPRGFAVAEIERLLSIGRRVIAMTWSPCPEYWADLGDLGAQIVVVGQQPDAVLGTAVTYAAYGARYQIAPEIPTPLTSTERQVLHLLARGYSNKQIAERTCMGYQRIRNIITDIYKSLSQLDTHPSNWPRAGSISPISRFPGSTHPRHAGYPWRRGSTLQPTP